MDVLCFAGIDACDRRDVRTRELRKPLYLADVLILGIEAGQLNDQER